MIEASNISNVISKVEELPIDRISVPQASLNLVNRNRTSLFPWRGQFSPELIELLLERYANAKTVVLDPYVGSGTTLFESARKSLNCIGVEINPAAVEMARMVYFTSMSANERKQHLDEAETAINNLASLFENNTTLLTFNSQKQKREKGVRSREEEAQNILNSSILFSKRPVRNLVINTLLRYACLKNAPKINTIWRAFDACKRIVKELPYTRSASEVFLCDSRRVPIEDGTVDIVITSPPYINVFNYHQNYRNIMELLGWNLLEVAKSEIGSNRKNRGNRFLTVIQYAIDMLQSLTEMNRVLTREGRIIVVIGRESMVRGVSFENYKILSALATAGAGLSFITRQERKFVTRFGATIFEDILHFAPAQERRISPPDHFARDVAVSFLEKSKHGAPTKIIPDITAAIEHATEVTASPIFTESDCKS